MFSESKQIIFNLEMSRSVNEGIKIQTRRVIKGIDRFQNLTFSNLQGYDKLCALFDNKKETTENKDIPYEFKCIRSKYKTGDILWLREPAKVTHYDPILLEYDFVYLSDNKEVKNAKIPDRFYDFKDPKIPVAKKWITQCQGVPNGCIREMARTFLVVTGVRVEKIQDIIVGDALLGEGIIWTNRKDLIFDNISVFTVLGKDEQELSDDEKTVRKLFVDIWDNASSPGHKWDDNPYVFVYEFKVLEENE